MGRKKQSTQSPTIENRRARHDYAVSETLEVGIALRGTEVKSVRDGKVSLAEGYVRATSDPPALMLYSVNIAEYPPAGAQQHKPTRPRTLLAHRSEIRKLARLCESKGTTIIPLKMYFSNGFAKVLVGVATGRRREDKRERIAKRDAERDIQRAMSRRMKSG